MVVVVGGGGGTDGNSGSGGGSDSGSGGGDGGCDDDALFNSYITYLDLEGKNRTDITYLKYTQMFLDEMRPPLAPSSKYRPHIPMTPGYKPPSKKKKKKEEIDRKRCKTKKMPRGAKSAIDRKRRW